MRLETLIGLYRQWGAALRSQFVADVRDERGEVSESSGPSKLSCTTLLASGGKWPLRREGRWLPASVAGRLKRVGRIPFP